MKEVSGDTVKPPVGWRQTLVGFKEQHVKARQKKKRLHVPLRKHQKPPAAEIDAVLELVRDGVRRFILNGAPIAEFQKALRVASLKGERSYHPLTGVAFRRIVKQAISERQRKTSGK